MMIGRVDRVGAAAATLRAQTGPGFAVATEAAPAPASIATTAPVGLLALQTQADPVMRDRAARRQGQAMLAALTALQKALLDGQEATAVEHLAALAALAHDAADPALRGVLAAIRLRAAIELAKHGRDTHDMTESG